MPLHVLLSSASFLHLLTPILYRSSSTSSNHLVRGLPLFLLPLCFSSIALFGCLLLCILWTCLKRSLDSQYFCTIFEFAQRYWTFVGTIGKLCNVIDGIKTFWNILRNLEILCRLWVVLHNILSVLLFRFSFFCLLIDYENKMWRKSICYWMYRTV